MLMLSASPAGRQADTASRWTAPWHAPPSQAEAQPNGADGRAPLHWGAYKGYADTVRLLLVMGARMGLPDKEGCTPLHWGAIRGNGEACTLLLQVGVAVKM